MNPIKFEIAAVAIILALIAGFGGGWAVQGWRMSGELNEQRGIVSTQIQSLATLKGANERCTAGVADVKGAVKVFVDAAAKRSEQAAAAMREAAKRAEVNQKAAEEALNRPPAPHGRECETAAAEATRYAQNRKGAP